MSDAFSWQSRFHTGLATPRGTLENSCLVFYYFCMVLQPGVGQCIVTAAHTVCRSLPELRETPVLPISFDPNSGRCSCLGLTLRKRNDVSCQKVLSEYSWWTFHLHAEFVAWIEVWKILQKHLNRRRLFADRAISLSCSNFSQSHCRILLAHKSFYRPRQRLMQSGKQPPDGAKANSYGLERRSRYIFVVWLAAAA